MTIRKVKERELEERMARLELFESDIDEKFILGSGKGGQKVNKTSSCVYLRHNPTGIEIKCQQERSRALNRYRARQMLCEKVEEALFKEKSERQQKIAKIRRQKKRRSRKQQEKMLAAKKARGALKSLRQSPSNE